MRKITCVFMLFVGIMLSLTGCGSDKVRIQLKENPTTGYQWFYTMEPVGILEEVRSEYVEPIPIFIGAIGKHVWDFKAVADGEVTITFVYRRSPELDPEGTTVVYRYGVSNGLIQEIK